MRYRGELEDDLTDMQDVRLAKKHGLAGCILSNHGGRQLDQARTGFDSLRAIHQEDPRLCKQIELYVDGGIRRGTDVLLALAYGAKGVGLGRSFLWAQTAYGEEGVIRAVRSESRRLDTLTPSHGERDCHGHATVGSDISRPNQPQDGRVLAGSVEVNLGKLASLGTMNTAMHKYYV